MTPDSQDHTVLIVEDDTIGPEYLEVLTYTDGIHPVLVQSAEAALDYLAKNPVHLVVTDTHLPGIHGDELIDRVKKAYEQTAVAQMSNDPDTLLDKPHPTWLKPGHIGEFAKFAQSHLS